MNIKSHPEYWNTHKKIWQQEYDNLNSEVRKIVMNSPHNLASKDFNKLVNRLVERELLSPVE
jgi:hypothetical protein